jgi:hypothetical protein
MANEREVTCTKKEHSSKHSEDKYISHVGGAGFNETEDAAIRQIRAETYSYFTKVDGKRAEIHICNGKKREFLKTKADDYKPNNLLNLKDCP